MNGELYFFKESNGLDVDAIVEFKDGTWMAFEIKSSENIGVTEAITNFAKFKKIINPAKWQKLISLNIVTGGSNSYTRDDGVNVIAFGHLCF
jgi:hypothetical protein